MTQRNGTIAGTCHNDIKTKNGYCSQKGQNAGTSKVKNQDIIIFCFRKCNVNQD